MIEQTDEGVVVSCDDCSTEIVLHFQNRERIRKHLAMHNWAFYQERSGDYHYRCPICVETYNQAHRVPVPVHQG